MPSVPVLYDALFSIGTPVDICGVDKKPELNGKCGKIAQRKGSRWGVVVDGFPNVYILKQDKLCIRPPSYPLFPGAVVRINGLKGKPELNGRIACAVGKHEGGNGVDRWGVQLDAGELQHISVKGANLEVVNPHVSPALMQIEWDATIAEVDALAAFIVNDFVEGPGRYHVRRRLAKVRIGDGFEELFPETTGPEESYSLAAWSHLPEADATRLFYKMSVSMRCTELSFYFAEIANRMAHARRNPQFRGSVIPKMFFCCGFVRHDYRSLRLHADFGNNNWQHSHVVNNQSRNHFWIEFPQDGAPAADHKNRIILDLAAAQFDMRIPGKSFLVSTGSDSRYHKCFEVPISCAPVYFAKWMCSLNLVNFDGFHLIENIQRVVRDHNIGEVSQSCLDAHAHLKDVLTRLESRKGGGVGKDEFFWKVCDTAKMKTLERDCGMTMSLLEQREQQALMTMESTMGSGSMVRISVI